MKVKVTIGLSHKKHLPVLKIGQRTFAFWQINRIREIKKAVKKFRVEQTNDGYEVRYKGYDLRLSPYHATMLIDEWSDWEEFYHPVSLLNKRVLDIGSGCLETASFFLAHGASHVSCIESDAEKCAIAIENKKRNNLPVEIINEKFSLDHLAIAHDFFKMDIEGYETELLKYNGNLKPCVIETHSKDTAKQLSDKFQLKEIGKMGNCKILFGGS